MSEKIKEVVKRLRDRAEARRRSGKLLQIDDRMFDLIADEIEEGAKALEADRDNWRRQALDEDARANATHKDSLAVGDMAAMREALRKIHLIATTNINECACNDSDRTICKLTEEALAKPPRNCDVYTEAQLCKRVTEKIKSELGNIPQDILDIVDIVAKGMIRSLFADAKGEQK